MPGLARRLVTLLAVLLSTVFTLGTPAYFIYNNARSLIVTEIGEKAINISVTIAAFIENDIEQFLALPAYVLPDAEDSDTEDEDLYLYEGPFYGDEDYGDDDAYDDYSDDDAYDEDYGDINDYGEAYIDEDLYGEHELGAWDDEEWDDEEWDNEEWDNEEYENDGLPVDTSTRIAPSQHETGPTATDGTLTEEYLNTLSLLLARISEETGAEVYIEKRLSETTKGFVFEQGSRNRGTGSSRMTQEEISIFNEGQRSASDLLHDSAIGEYLKGYAPITDPATGNTVGLVVTEFALSHAYVLMSGITSIILISFVVMFLLTSAVVYRLISSRMKYLVKDVLTDLCNRRYFEKVLKRQVKNVKISGKPLSLMMIDVDHFKKINDTMGHGVGDEVLKAVSNVLLSSIRRFDVCCRYGGDEFVVVLPDTEAVQAAAVAERMRGAVSSLQFSPNGHPLGVTLSIGIAVHCAHMTADQLKEKADYAMYVSKNSGKNRITVTPP